MSRTSTARRAEQNREAQAAAIRSRLDRQRRRQRLIVATAVAAVLVAVAVIAIVSATGGSSTSSKSTASASPVPAAVMQQVTGVPSATLDAVGMGTTKALPKPVNDPALTKGGKPLVLYIGAEYCPYCAAERWPLVQALSRFGTFTNLSTTTSAAEDVFPNTPTFTFHGSTYTSDYLAFEGPELYTNKRQGNGYTPLDTISADRQQLLQRYGSGFPFLDMAGRYVVTGATYDPTVLKGKDWAQISGSLADAKSPVAQGVDGAANVLTAALCKVTGGKPGNVCTAPAVTAAAAQLGG